MNLRDNDLEWMASNFPELTYDPGHRVIVGGLRFCAAFDRDSGQLKLGDTAEHRAINTFVCDTFTVKVELEKIDNNGWPKVYELMGRSLDIAEQNQCYMADLHFCEDGTCCLGLNFAAPRNLSLERFILELVIPFFYRLSYVDRYGLKAAQHDLWGEYSHADAGVREYQGEILRLAASSLGRNQPCPCGSGIKYKRCHLDEVEAVKKGIPR